MVIQKERVFERIKPPKELEEVLLEQLADRHFAYNSEVLPATVEAIVASLVVTRLAVVKGLGTFAVAHLRSKGKAMKYVITFTPLQGLLKKVEAGYVKL